MTSNPVTCVLIRKKDYRTTQRHREAKRSPEKPRHWGDGSTSQRTRISSNKEKLMGDPEPDPSSEPQKEPAQPAPRCPSPASELGQNTSLWFEAAQLVMVTGRAALGNTHTSESCGHRSKTQNYRI